MVKYTSDYTFSARDEAAMRAALEEAARGPGSVDAELVDDGRKCYVDRSGGDVLRLCTADGRNIVLAWASEADLGRSGLGRRPRRGRRDWRTR